MTKIKLNVKDTFLKCGKRILLWRMGIIFMLIIFSTDFACAQLPPDFNRIQLAANLSSPTCMVHTPDGRIFIGEQTGGIRVFKNGAVLGTRLATVSTTRNGERGLGGMVLHPNFSSNGYLYVYYTRADGTFNEIIRYTVVGDLGTNPLVILTLDRTVNTNHNGGSMLFGPDGKLYVAVGESNVPSYSNNLDTYHGKLLRLNEDGTPSPGNPYYGSGSRQRQSIWAIGFRNPWTMNIDPLTNRIFINDVGGNYEEINDVTTPAASRNYDYGWNGAQRSGPEQPASTIPAIFAYDHGQGCAITNGFFYNPTNSNWPAQYRNKYYYTDWCRSDIRYIDPDNPTAGMRTFASGVLSNATGFSVGIDGSLYAFNWVNGTLHKIEYTSSQVPQIVQQPTGSHYLCNNENRTATIPAGQQLTLSVLADGAAPLSYQWRRNGINIPGATSANYQINALASSHQGAYTVQVSNNAGLIISSSFNLTVSPFSTNPVATIATPVGGTRFSGGQIISFSGTGTDQEEGNLPASNINWEIRFYHEDSPETSHWHPGPLVPQGTASGSFTTSVTGETSPNVWYRILMYLRDASGLRDTAYIDIHPNLSSITAQTEPSGLLVNLNGQSASPRTVTSVTGVDAYLEAVTPQVVGNRVYEFSHWQHGGQANQVVSTPSGNTTYTAIYTTSQVQQVDVPMLHDTYLRGGPHAGIVHGVTNPTELETKYTENEAFQRETYFMIDLSQYSNVSNAELKVFNSAAAPGGIVEIYPVANTSWSETTLTWANRPPRGSTPISTANVTVAGQYYTWDISTYVLSELAAGRTRIALAMRNASETGPQTKWNSKETGSNPPLLTISMSESDDRTDFSANTTTICNGGQVTFTPDANGNISAYNWNFGTGASPATATGAGPHTVTYNTSGNATVRLIVTRAGVNDTIAKNNYISVSPVPVASAVTGNANPVCGANAMVYSVTGNAQNYRWSVPTGATIVSGQGTPSVTVNIGTSGGNITVVPANGNCEGTPSSLAIAVSNCGQNPYGGTPAPIPGRIEAEAYDTDGQGIAYNDLTPGNTGGAFRTDNVDIEACSEGGFNVGWIDEGEWLAYTVNVTTTGIYSISYRLSSPNTGRLFHLEVDNVNVTGDMTVPNTGGWQNWATVTSPDIALTEGIHVLRFVIKGTAFNLNYIDFALQTPVNLVADFTANTTSICQGTAVTFTSTSTGDISSYDWNFGLGATPATASGIGPHTVTYQTAGEASVSLEVSGNSQTDRMAKPAYIRINGNPSTPAITGPTSVACMSNGVTYRVAPTTGSTYAWSASGDAQVIEDAHNDHAHVNFGTTNAVISVTETNLAGCIGTPRTLAVNVQTCQVSEYEIEPIHDAYVRGGVNANNAYGTLNPGIIETKNTPDNLSFTREAYLKFDLSAISQPVTTAKLRVYGNSPSGNITVAVTPVSNIVWNEANITWNNRPARGQNLNTVIISPVMQYYEFDVTSYIQSELSANRNVVSLNLHNITNIPGSQIFLNTKEASANKPQLVLSTGAARMAFEGTGKLSGDGMKIYPNPASKQVTIAAEAESGSGIVISFTDILGNEVLRLEPDNQYSGWFETTVNISDLTSGIYFIKLVQNSNISVSKLIIE